MEQLNDLVRTARARCPFYEESLKDVSKISRLEDLPIVDTKAYWTSARVARKEVMTGTQDDGLIVSSGGEMISTLFTRIVDYGLTPIEKGTSGLPKFTHYSSLDFQRFATQVGVGLIKAGLRPGDRVANMFLAGDLYIGFLGVAFSLMSLPIPIIQIPVGGWASNSSMCEYIDHFQATVLGASMTSLTRLAEYCIEHKRTFPLVRRIVCAGDSVYPEHQTMVLSTFPQATIRSFFYGSSDSGPLAYGASDTDAQLLEVLPEGVMVEIVGEDDAQEVIRDNHTPGIVVATNLMRELSPVIRFPVGDRAEWVDYEARTFRILGRVRNARVGQLTIDMEDVRRIVRLAMPGVQIRALQAIITHEGVKDCLECAIAATPPDAEDAKRAIVSMFHSERPLFGAHVEAGNVAPLKVRFTRIGDMYLSKPAEKLIEIVDLRVT